VGVSSLRIARADALMVLLRLTLVAAAAGLAADGVNQWLVGQWRVPPAPPRAPAAPAPEGPRPQSPVSFSGITDRNIFNSTPAPAVVPARPAVSTARPVPVIQPLNLNVRLTGTVVGGAPANSFAMILDVARRDESLYRLGDKVLGEGVVVKIDRDQVVLRRGEAEQVLRLFEEEEPPQRTAAVVPFGSAPPEAVGQDEFRFVVDRGEIDEALSDMPRLLTQARLLPNFRAGQTDGFRIFNIVPGSLFARIGLKNGDVLHRINDTPIDDPTKFMGIFQELKDETHISVDLVRGGDRKTFEYEIR
jgi:general secretion pathway protein C